jgi:hypothetical protein
MLYRSLIFWWLFNRYLHYCINCISSLYVSYSFTYLLLLLMVIVVGYNLFYFLDFYLISRSLFINFLGPLTIFCLKKISYPANTIFSMSITLVLLTYYLLNCYIQITNNERVNIIITS